MKNQLIDVLKEQIKNKNPKAKKLGSFILQNFKDKKTDVAVRSLLNSIKTSKTHLTGWVVGDNRKETVKKVEEVVSITMGDIISKSVEELLGLEKLSFYVDAAKGLGLDLNFNEPNDFVFMNELKIKIKELANEEE